MPILDRKFLAWAGATTLAILGCFLFADLTRGRALEILTRLATGWIRHLQETAPMTTWDWTSIGVAGLVLVVLLIACQWIAHSRLRTKWAWRWTSQFMAALFLITGAGGAAGLLIHHLSYFFREPIFYYNDIWDSTRNINNARQLITALRIYANDHSGEYPEKLDDLVKEEILDPGEPFEKLTHGIMQKQMKIPWMVLGGLNDSAPGGLPLVVSPIPLHGSRYVMGYNDMSVELVSPEKYQAAMAAWEAWLKENHKPRTTIPLR